MNPYLLCAIIGFNFNLLVTSLTMFIMAPTLKADPSVETIYEYITLFAGIIAFLLFIFAGGVGCIIALPLGLDPNTYIIAFAVGAAANILGHFVGKIG